MKATDALGCVGAVTVLLFASAWIPLLGPFVSLLTPLPFIYYTSKLGFYEGIKTAGIAVLVVGLIAHFSGLSQVLFLCLEFAFLGIILAEILKRQLDWGYGVFLGTALMLLVGAVFLGVVGLAKGSGPAELILDYFQRNLQETLMIYDGMEAGEGQDPQILEYVSALTGLMARVYPALIIIGTAFVVWLNMVLSRPLFRLTRLGHPDFGRADLWRAPDMLVWGVIGTGFALFVPATGIRFVATNALIVLLVVYVFQGLSIVLFFFNKYKVNPWLRGGFYFLIFFQQVALAGLALAGLFDQWIDFRKIHSKRSH